jgi:LysR family transcriptional regulator, glycine cleavage system transcriptional activator
MPSLAALRGFDAVARHGGYTDAAAALNVTEAALRQHVRHLEAFLGQVLIERRGRGIALTDVGGAFAAAIRQGFDALFAAVDAILGEDTRRPLKVALTPAFAENWLLPRLGEFWARHPEIEIELMPSLKLEDLRAGRFDMAIRYGQGSWPGCKSTLLASAAHTVVARPEIALACPIRDVADLRHLHWLFESDRREHRLWAEKHGIDFDAEHNRRYPTNSLVLSALRAGQGVALQARALIQRDLDSGFLTEVYAEPSSALGYYIVTQSKPRPPLGKFIGWLREVA